MIGLLRPAFTALREGERLTHASTWKNAQLATAALVALLGAIVAVLRIAGVELPATDTDLAAIAGGLVAVYGVFDAYVTAASSRKVGLPNHAEPATPASPSEYEPGKGHDIGLGSD